MVGFRLASLAPLATSASFFFPASVALFSTVGRQNSNTGWLLPQRWLATSPSIRPLAIRMAFVPAFVRICFSSFVLSFLLSFGYFVFDYFDSLLRSRCVILCSSLAEGAYFVL
ncbi:unnamed protein product [Arabidopsis lyrata]|uniref:Expressed protein n=1 Tax=Arabidopsis lyrata subsp. lyrata TaxID=81972 RepID=D7L7C5_ARALL|nr:expressed protein [Arabidopsis lyrata subsp. lyrata]CAH8260871.1 unnamed protein product [Arabidopsis lyrata]